MSAEQYALAARVIHMLPHVLATRRGSCLCRRRLRREATMQRWRAWANTPAASCMRLDAPDGAEHARVDPAAWRRKPRRASAWAQDKLCFF